mmetsp:Transcript_24387/g.77250  ORF Transcript_24387/g.77250 Transcript_24387/m.77250 type:complete len:588 (-) Transcript_24387:95-1858(-)
MDVDLRPVKGAVARVEGPAAAALCLVLVERLRDHRLGGLPHRGVAKRALGLGREVERKVHPEPAVDGRDHVEHVGDLLLDLRDHAKDVRVVLLEAAHAREAGERARELVAVQHAEVGHAEGQLAVGALAVLEHEAVARAVHRLEREGLPLAVEHEHVLRVLSRVARGLPQLEVVHVRRDDLLVAPEPQLPADELDKLVVQPTAERLEEARAGREVVEEKELLLDADRAVVALLGLLLQRLPLAELLLVGEGDAVHALQLVVARLAEPVGGRVFGQLEGLDAARAGEVRPLAEVDEGAAAVDGRRGAIRQLGRDERLLEGVRLEDAEALLLADHHALEGLLLVDDQLGPRLELAHLLLVHRRLPHERVVEEAAVRRRAVRQVGAEERLERLAEDVRRRVPERDLPLRVAKLVQLELARALERAVQVPQLPVFGHLALLLVGTVCHRDHASLQRRRQPLALCVRDARDAARLRQALGDGGGDVERRGDEGGRGADRAVGKRHGDGRFGDRLQECSLPRHDRLKHVVAALHPRWIGSGREVTANAHTCVGHFASGAGHRAAALLPAVRAWRGCRGIARALHARRSGHGQI